ncbi:MAG: rhodanese-like domain-containing protein [Chromatiales bacterium]|jgi:rhodanese-related sulfurtransferase
MPLADRLKRRLWWVPFGRVPEISAQALEEARGSANPPQILDVRTRTEWRRSRIPGAVNVPVAELRRRLPGLDLDPRRPVVTICLSAHRSIPAVRLLQARGRDDAVQLEGGMLAWWRRDLPVEADR